MSRLRQLVVMACLAFVFAGNVGIEGSDRFVGETGARSSLGMQCNAEPVVAPQGSSAGGDGGSGGSGVKRCKP